MSDDIMRTPGDLRAWRAMDLHARAHGYADNLSACATRWNALPEAERELWKRAADVETERVGRARREVDVEWLAAVRTQIGCLPLDQCGDDCERLATHGRHCAEHAIAWEVPDDDLLPLAALVDRALAAEGGR